MKDQFATYEIAKKLKELGFNEPCLGYFTPSMQFILANTSKTLSIWDVRNGFLIVPLWQQAIKWLKEKHNIRISIDLNSDADLYYIRKGKDLTKRGYLDYAVLLAIDLIDK